MRYIPKLQIKHKWAAIALYLVFGLCCLLGILFAITYFSTSSDVTKITGTVISYTESQCQPPRAGRSSLAQSSPCYRPIISYQYKNQLRNIEGARTDSYPPVIGAKQEIYARESSRGEIFAADYSQRHTPLILGIILLTIFLPALLITIRIRKRTLQAQDN